MRPQGVLINLQPYAKPIAVDVHRDGSSARAGFAWENETKRSEMKASLREVDALVSEGLFALRDESTWQLQMRYNTAEDWREFLERPVAGRMEVDQALLDAAFSEPGAYVLTTEDDLAAAYEK